MDSCILLLNLEINRSFFLGGFQIEDLHQEPSLVIFVSKGSFYIFSPHFPWLF
jgi:hypothetical protein